MADSPNRILGRAALRDVGGQREAGDIALFEERGRFVQRGLGAGHERDARAFLAETRRDRASDSAAGSRHDDHAPVRQQPHPRVLQNGLAQRRRHDDAQPV